jgi:dehydrogenase/reductase SDR family member 12
MSSLSFQLRGLAFYARNLLSFTQIGFVLRRLPALPTQDLSNQTWLVTGASGGLGRAIAERAAEQGAFVIAVARSREKLAQCRGVTVVEVCDFSLQSETDALLQRLVASKRPVDVLVNNVGSMASSFVATAEGRESTFATNLLSHFQLTEGLLNARLLSDSAVVINMSSGGAYLAPLSVKTLLCGPGEFDGAVAYAHQKRAQIVLNDYWRAKFGDRAQFFVMHPGWVDTAGVQTALPGFRAALKAILRDDNSGIDTAMWLTATRPTQDTSGIWFDRSLRPAHAFAFTKSSEDTAETLVSALEGELQSSRRRSNRSPA